jgi:hypothetical protein
MNDSKKWMTSYGHCDTESVTDVALRSGSTNLGPDFMRRCLASAREYAKRGI